MSGDRLAVMVLAGGKGTRLRSVVDGRPKVMADVNGRPFLDFILDHLQDQGLEQVTLLTGYLAEMIEGHYGSRYGQLALGYSRETTPLGTGGAVRRALLHNASDAQTCVVINGDTYFPADLRRALDAQAGVSNVMLTTAVAEIGRYGSLHVEAGSGRVLRFTEKGQSGPGLINAGTYLLRSDVIRSVEAEAFSLEEELLVPLAAAGRLQALQDPAPFIDIGIPADYAAFQAWGGG